MVKDTAASCRESASLLRRSGLGWFDPHLQNVTPAAGRVAFDGADYHEGARSGYILDSGRLVLTGTSADLPANDLHMGLDGATAIDDDVGAAREADGVAVEEKEPR